MKVFTVEKGCPSYGAKVKEVKIKSADFSFKAISIGEYGHGRRLANLPVDQRAVEVKNGKEIVFRASLGETKSLKPKLVKETKTENDECVVVFRTPIGFRGSNEHTGDDSNGLGINFLPFPGKIVTSGIIAQGDAGRMGSGEHLIAIMPKNIVFRTAYSGRLHGAPDEHYHMFDGEKIISLTRKERDASDIF